MFAKPQHGRDRMTNVFAGRSVALLVIDMQERFRKMMSEEMIGQVNKTIKFCRQKKVDCEYNSNLLLMLHECYTCTPQSNIKYVCLNVSTTYVFHIIVGVM